MTLAELYEQIGGNYDHALQIMRKDKMINKYLVKLKDSGVYEGLMEAGKTLATALTNEGTLPDLAIEMSAVGEQTGALENTLDVMASYFDVEVETATTRAMSILEPSIIVVLAIIVFILLLSVYLPMFSMYGSL